jgi:methylated-DNA-[protein]-cysteine S-methyltransferase
VRIRIAASDAGVSAVQFSEDEALDGAPHPLAVEAGRQLQAYFEGRLYRFDLPLDFHGTDFQVRAWKGLLDIPYGETRSYLQQAQSVGAAHAVRAIGAANGANPIAIVAPCHRVIGSSGKLTGYGGGLPLKKALLELEARWAWKSRERAMS